MMSKRTVQKRAALRSQLAFTGKAADQAALVAAGASLKS